MHIPSLEGVYQTLTKQQEIIYRLNAKLKLLKSKLGICDDVKKTKNSNINATIESLSDSIISMSLIDQIENETPKLSEKKLKELRNTLSNREVTIIRPQRPKYLGLNSEIVLEKRANAIKSLRKKPESVAIQKPTALPVQKPIQTTTLPTAQNVAKPPSQSSFNVGQIQGQKNLFASTQPTSTVQAAATPQSIQQALSMGKKPEEINKSASSFSFGGGNQQPAFGSLNLSANSTPFGLSSTQARNKTQFLK